VEEMGLDEFNKVDWRDEMPEMEMARIIGWVPWMILFSLSSFTSNSLLLIPKCISESDVEIDRRMPTQTPIHLLSLVENSTLLSHDCSIGKHVKFLLLKAQL
jgi:hypothetical protein